MRKLFIILFLVAGFVNAQNIIVSSKNSTTTALGSAATYTGTAELNTNYSYLTIVVKSNVSGASNGVIVKMGATATTLYTNQFFTYTVNDSSTNRFTVHLTGKYFKIVYINGTTDQTTFDLKTYMHTEEVLPVDANGNIKVNVAVSVLPSGASTAAKQDTIISRLTVLNAKDFATQTTLALIPPLLDSLEVDIEAIRTTLHADLLALGVKIDSTDASSTRIETKLDNIHIRQADGNQTTRAVSYSLPSYTTFTAGVSADTLSGTSVACVKVTIMNASAGKILYYGFDGSVTTANGQGALGYLDTATLYVTNLNKIYLISDSASTDVRITYYNY